MHIIRHDISTVPTEEKQFVDWLDRIWEEKDRRLQNFIDHNTLVLDSDKK